MATLGECNKMENARVLLIDDTASDTKLFEVAARKARWIKEIRVSSDGIQALELLRSKEPSKWMPHLILLDLHMPRMNGFEFLENLKNDENLRHIPTLVLTTSSASEDIEKAYNRNANCFLTKPSDFPGLQAMLVALEDFWFGVATVPPIF